MILNIRGTSGAGKSTIVYKLMELCGSCIQLMEKGPNPRPVVGYSLFERRVAVVGRYETACGGCDTIKTQDAVCNRVRQFAVEAPHVVFEGLLVSQIYQRYANLANEYAGSFKFLCLDTPLDVCVERVRARRLAAGNTKPFDPDNSLTPKWHSCQANYLKAKQDGLDPVWLDHRDPMPQVLALLGVS